MNFIFKMQCYKCQKSEFLNLPCCHLICKDCLFCFACPICNLNIIEYDFTFDVKYYIKDEMLVAIVNEMTDKFGEKNNLFLGVIYDTEFRILDIDGIVSFEGKIQLHINLSKLKNFKYICLRRDRLICNGISKIIINIEDESLFEIEETDTVRYISQIERI